MKKVLFAFIVLVSQSGYSQDIRFNDELDKFCRQTKKDFASIPVERKAMLNSIAEQLTVKKYIGFTCPPTQDAPCCCKPGHKLRFFFMD